MISGVCKQYRPQKKTHVHRENDESHSTPRPDKTKWTYVEQNEWVDKLEVCHQKWEGPLPPSSQRSEIWQLKSGRIIIPLKHRKTLENYILLYLAEGASWVASLKAMKMDSLTQLVSAAESLISSISQVATPVLSQRGIKPQFLRGGNIGGICLFNYTYIQCNWLLLTIYTPSGELHIAMENQYLETRFKMI